jgi:hypothetical protein
MSPVDMNDERMRAGLAALLEIKGDGEECPPAGTIWDSVEGRLERERNEAVLIHLGECAACSAAWRLARRLYSEEAKSGGQAEEVPIRRRLWFPLAAAAVIVLGLGLGTLHLLTRQELPPEYRTQEDRWLESELAPGQPLPRDECVLRWTAGPEGTTYELRVTTEDLEPLARAGRLEWPEYRVDPGVLDGVPPGGALLWRVTAHLPDGSRISSRTFTTPLE